MVVQPAIPPPADIPRWWLLVTSFLPLLTMGFRSAASSASARHKPVLMACALRCFDSGHVGVYANASTVALPTGPVLSPLLGRAVQYRCRLGSPCGVPLTWLLNLDAAEYTDMDDAMPSSRPGLE